MHCDAIIKQYKSTPTVQQQYAALEIISIKEETMGRLLSTTRGHSKSTLNIQMRGITSELHSIR